MRIFAAMGFILAAAVIALAITLPIVWLANRLYDKYVGRKTNNNGISKR